MARAPQSDRRSEGFRASMRIGLLRVSDMRIQGSKGFELRQ